MPLVPSTSNGRLHQFLTLYNDLGENTVNIIINLKRQGHGDDYIKTFLTTEPPQVPNTTTPNIASTPPPNAYSSSAPPIPSASNPNTPRILPSVVDMTTHFDTPLPVADSTTNEQADSMASWMVTDDFQHDFGLRQAKSHPNLRHAGTLRCRHCGKAYTSGGWLNKHENGCKVDPAKLAQIGQRTPNRDRSRTRPARRKPPSIPTMMAPESNGPVTSTPSNLISSGTYQDQEHTLYPNVSNQFPSNPSVQTVQSNHRTSTINDAADRTDSFLQLLDAHF